MAKPQTANSVLRKMKASIPKVTNIASNFVLPNHSGDLSRGKVLTTPTTDYNPVNKAYVDAQIAGEDHWDRVGTSLTPHTTTDSINIDDTTTATTGIIFKDGDRFVHNFHHPTGSTATPDGHNTFLGIEAGNFTVGSTATAAYMASHNTVMGTFSGKGLTTGYNNTIMGSRSGRMITTGQKNSILGDNAGTGLTTGRDNLFLGADCGQGITTGSDNTIIGANVTGLAADLQNNIILADGDGVIRYQVNDTGVTTIGDGTNSLLVASNGDTSFEGTAGLYPRFLTQSAEPAAGTGATQLDTSEMCIWKDSDDNKVYMCFNDGGTVKTVEMA